MLTDKKLKPLSVVPYYGGKYNMAYLIADMLPYKGFDIYVEPFGGGGRVLLNKARHKEEYYGELSEGIATLFDVLSHTETADKLIHCLYDTEISEEYFNECKLYKNYREDDYFTFKLDIVLNRLNDLDKGKKVLKNSFTKAIKSLLSKKYYERYVQEGIPDNIYQENFIENMAAVFNEFKSLCREYDLDKADIVYLDNAIYLFTEMIIITYNYIYKNKMQLADRKSPKDKTSKGETWEDEAEIRYTSVRNEIDDAIFDYNEGCIEKEEFVFPHLDKIKDESIKLAVATYVVYTQSRDALGIKWKGNKFKSRAVYENHIAQLTEAAKRLKGVMVYKTFPAELFLVKRQGTPIEHFNNWIDFVNNPKACMYLDPSYLKAADVERDNYNPGIYYKRYYTKSQHINLLKSIQMARCYVIVSNYDDEEHLYARYLELGEGLSDEEKRHFKPFKRCEVKTKSTLNPQKAVDRIECLWYREGIK